MRIAICFSGQIRTGHIVAPNILRYIGDLLPDCDFFAHTWDEESIGTGHARRLQLNDVSPEVHTTQLTDQEKAKQFYSWYTPKVMRVDPYSAEPTRPLWGGRRYDSQTKKWYVSMWRSLWEANQLKIEYTQTTGREYDITVRIRPDLVFHPDKTLAEDIRQLTKPNQFLTGDQYNLWASHGPHKLEDIFWLGPTTVMDTVSNYCWAYTDLVGNIDDPKHPDYRDWQFHSASWIHSLGLEFRPLADNRMRCYYDIDHGKDDYMRPRFGIDQYNPKD